ncbi:reverse transcriptase [Lasius niger]|uniref:Reverse transcriptase n=1 Tax=Lasius niger TaxID=67767 RepID=A0A0J7K6F7_LASNI|nr:reverse transcriptase [Lasius niger]
MVCNALSRSEPSQRTVSGNAAFLLAGIPPLKLLAPMRKRLYEKVRKLKEDGEYSKETRDAAKDEEYSRMYELWRNELEKPNTSGEYTKMAIVPRLEIWMARIGDSMSFHLTQLMTGHGCFGKFVHRIGKRPDPSCDFCGEEDDAFHTLRECPGWDPQRIRLQRKLELEQDFTLADIVDAVAMSRDRWLAFSAFAEEIMRKKEEEEKRRERARDATPSNGEDDSDE